MSTHVSSLKKQIELLQGEVELYANAVDRLATRLAEMEAPSSVESGEIDSSASIPALEREHDPSELAQ